MTRSKLENDHSRARTWALTSVCQFRVSGLGLRILSGAAVVAVSLILGFRLSIVNSRLLLGYNPKQDDVGGQASPAKWQGSSVTWHVNCATGSNVQIGGSGCPIEAPIKAAFNSWNTASLANGPVLTGIQLSEGAQTALTDPETAFNTTDCVNIVSFVPSSAIKFPTGVVAFTSVATTTLPLGQSLPFNYQCTSGGTTTIQSCNQPSCIVDADIMFNPADGFSTALPTPPSTFDIQSVATHEVGHMLGLDHSGIAHSVMYPFGDAGLGRQRNLSTDDTIGIAFLYPGSGFSSAVGTLTGQVTLNGAEAFAAHIVAIDSNTGNAVVDGLTDMQGNFSLNVPPGSYHVLALPLTGPYDLTNFGGWSCGYAGWTENAPPCCQPGTPMCSGTPLTNPTNFTGTFLN